MADQRTDPEPTITLKEGVLLLGDTGHPISESTLRELLAGCPRFTAGRPHRYLVSDLLERHRDWVDKQANHRRHGPRAFG